MIIPFIIAYFATGLLFMSLLIIFAFTVTKFWPDKFNDMVDKEWEVLIKECGDKVTECKILGQKVNRNNFIRLTFTMWCIEMFLFWPREIYNFCMKRR